MPDPRLAHLPLPIRIALPWNPPAVRRLRQLRRASGRHPEWWILLASAAAWVWMWTAPAHPAPDRGIVTAAVSVGAMIVAMMLPLTIGQLRARARRSPWRGRHRRTLAFVAGYLALWMLGMAVIQAAWSVSVGITKPAVAAAIVVAAAALWEIAPAKRRLHACDGGLSVGSGAGKTDGGCAVDGVAAGGRCMGACWALMGVCAAFAHSVPAMAVLFALQLNGRSRRALPPAGAALALVAMWIVSLAIGTGGSHHH